MTRRNTIPMDERHEAAALRQRAACLLLQDEATRKLGSRPRINQAAEALLAQAAKLAPAAKRARLRERIAEAKRDPVVEAKREVLRARLRKLKP